MISKTGELKDEALGTHKNLLVNFHFKQYIKLVNDRLCYDLLKGILSFKIKNNSKEYVNILEYHCYTPFQQMRVSVN